MRAAHRVGRTVTIRLRFDDFDRATRSHTLPRSTAHTATILDAVRGLIEGNSAMIRDRGLTLIGVSVGNLDDDDAVQLALPFDAASDDSIDSTVDAIRDRFGSDAIGRAVLLGRASGLSMPMLPD